MAFLVFFKKIKWFWAKFSIFIKKLYFRVLQLRRRRRNCSARKYLNFIKLENFAQNHFIFLKKLKRPKNLSYQKEQNLVFADFFLNLFNLKKITLCFSQIWAGIAIATPASQLQCPLILVGTAIVAPAHSAQSPLRGVSSPS